MEIHATDGHSSAPHINVTPLIDVLLVLLIIFMVVTPLKPARLMVKIPAKPNQTLKLPPWSGTLVVTIKADHTLMLNGLAEMGSVENTGRLSETLTRLFEQRKENHFYRQEMISRTDLPEDLRIETTVFIKAPRSIGYGEVARVIDSVKGAGATPIGLQVDNLD
ncbi:MAG: biopolymer transporter ExbD [bacterium]